MFHLVNKYSFAVHTEGEKFLENTQQIIFLYLFSKNYVYVCVSVCGYMHMSALPRVQKRVLDLPGARVTGNYELPVVDVGAQLESSIRVVHTLHLYLSSPQVSNFTSALFLSGESLENLVEIKINQLFLFTKSEFYIRICMFKGQGDGSTIKSSDFSCRALVTIL